MNAFTKTAIASLFGAAAVAASAQALAEDQYRLAYNPAQTSHAAGMQELRAKIRKAASAACPTYSESRSLPLVSACRAEVTRDLVAKVNVPEFTAFVEREDGNADADYVASVGR